MKGWETKYLGDVADLCLGKMLDEKKNRGESLPYLANVNVRWGAFDLSNLRQMRFEPHEMERYVLKYGDIVMCEGGEPGRCAIWKENKPGMMIQKALHRIRPHDSLDSTFLYYSFLHKGNCDGFQQLFTGSTIKHLPKQNLEKIEIKYPPLPVQLQISNILSTYDDLIENNRRRIALLEQSARLLYEEWFVRFRFPGHEKVKIANGLPEGWEKKKLRDISCHINRGIAPKYDDNGSSIVINQKCIRNNMLSFDQSRKQNKPYKKEKGIQLGDVLINSTGTGTLGRVAQCWIELDKCTVDSHVTIARPDKDIHMLWYGFTLLSFQDYFETMGEGSTNQKELGRKTIENVELVVPSQEIRELFERNVRDQVNQITTLTRQNKALATARDILLPRLMSGEIAV